MKRRIILRIIVLTLLIASIGFILYNSMLNGRESSVQSRAFYAWIKKAVKEFFSQELDLSDRFVRKAGHFIEFALFGTALFLFSAAFIKKDVGKITLFILSCALPFLDEYVQSYVKGRNSSFYDCLIDCGGLFTGFFLSFAIFAVLRLIARKLRERVKNH